MRVLFLGAMLAVSVLPATAQQNPAERNTRYHVQQINFDLWCQETQRLPPDRCDRRLPEDEAKFEAYRAAFEKYEIQYLKRKNSDIRFNQVILHPDPVPNQNPVSNPTDRQIASPKPNP